MTKVSFDHVAIVAPSEAPGISIATPPSEQRDERGECIDPLSIGCCGLVGIIQNNARSIDATNIPFNRYSN